MGVFNVRMVLVSLLAVVLTILPLPAFLAELRPPWVLLFVLYTQLFSPRHFSLGYVFLMGLCLDVLLSKLIGQHAFALLLTAWIASTRTRQYALFSTPQQVLWIGCLCLIYQSTITFIDAFQGYHYDLLSVTSSALMGLVVWVWIRWFGDRVLTP